MQETRPAAFAALQSDHHEKPTGAGELSRLGPARAIAGVELLYGRYRRFSFARHFHSVTAIGVVETGVMRTCHHNSYHCAPAGTVILLNPGDVHAPQSGNGSAWSFRMLYLDDALLRGLSRRSGSHRPLWFATPLVENPALYSELLSLHRSLETEPDALAVESRLVSVLEQIAKYSQWMGNRDVRPAARVKMHCVRDYLHAYAGEAVTLRTLSELADLSPWHLLRSFRAQFGLTPHAYQVQERVERGRRLLASGVPIADAAVMSGFVDQSHFTRQFKRFTGVTPGRYSARAAIAH